MKLKVLLKGLSYTLVITGCIYASVSSAQSLERFLDAVERGDSRAVSAFLDQGLDPNSSGPSGHTVLMAASRLGHLDVVRMLLARKSSPNRRSATGDSAVMMASLGGHLAIVKLLAESGAEISSQGWTALHYAAYGGSADVIRYLLERGADKNGLAPNWDSPLLLAVRSGNVAAVREVLLANPELGHRGKQGETALTIARGKQHGEMVELLRRAGVPE